MALDAAANHYADAAIDAIVALLAAEHGDDFDEDAARPNLEPMIRELETMVRSMLGDAEVAFASGDFGGTDSNGDTPDSITASGGAIS